MQVHHCNSNLYSMSNVATTSADPVPPELVYSAKIEPTFCTSLRVMIVAANNMNISAYVHNDLEAAVEQLDAICRSRLLEPSLVLPGIREKWYCLYQHTCSSFQQCFVSTLGVNKIYWVLTCPGTAKMHARAGFTVR